MDLTIPGTFYIHVTGRCNYSCIYCYNRGTWFRRLLTRELATRELLHFFRELMTYSPRRIALTGGEPLLRDDLEQLSAYLLRTLPGSASVSLNTNGSRITADNVEWLVDSFDEIGISIDGFRSVNDMMRGSGAFDRALNAVSLIRDAGGVPSVSVTRTSLNSTQIEGFIAYMQHEWGIRSFRINDVKMIGRAAGSPWLLPGSGSCGNAGDRDPPQGGSCFHGQKCLGETMNILPDGDCYPCHFLQEKPFFLGNIRKKPLSVILQGMRDLKNGTGSPCITPGTH